MSKVTTRGKCSSAAAAGSSVWGRLYPIRTERLPHAGGPLSRDEGRHPGTGFDHARVTSARSGSVNFQRCEQLADQEFDGRQCACYLIEYKDAAGSPTYRKSISLIDKEWSIPLYVKNYGWPLPDVVATEGDALDEATLIEFYSFAEVQFRLQLVNGDFDRNNEEYRLQ